MYSPRFYKENAPLARSSAQALVPELIRLLAPRAVVDLGCGTGTWLAVFLEAGVDDVVGVDLRMPKSGGLEIPTDCFVEADLSRPFNLGRRFDLALCLEVGENLAPSSSDTLVTSLTGLADCVLFSSAVPRQGGYRHLNEQWPEYWAKKFRARGYAVLDCIRPRVWTDPNVAWWYAQNAVLYVRSSMRDPPAALKAEMSHPASSVRSLVHPRSRQARLSRSAFSPSRVLGELRAWFRRSP